MVSLKQLSANRYVKLMADAFVFAVGTLLVKLLQFFLLPLYTTALSPEEYGVAEMVNNFVELLIPFATLSIATGVFRYAIDSSVDRNKLLTSGLTILLFAELVFFVVAAPVALFFHIPYFIIFSFLLIAEAARLFAGGVVRGFGHVKRFAAGGPITTLTLFVSNIILLVVLKVGIYGYLYSLIISNVVTTFFYVFASRLDRYFHVRAVDPRMILALLTFSLPMIFNMVGWWGMNMAGRYIILWQGSAALAGFYIAASKLPGIINMASNIFYQAWQYATAKEEKSADRDVFFSKVFRYYGKFVLFFCSFTLAASPYLAKLLLKKEFINASYLLPTLIFGATLNCFSNFFGTFYNAFKKNAMIMVSTLTGATIAILGGWFGYRFFGSLGVAVAGSVAFITITAIRAIDTRRFVSLRVEKFTFAAAFIIVLSQIALETNALATDPSTIKLLRLPLSAETASRASQALFLSLVALIVLTERRALVRACGFVARRVGGRRE